MTHQRLHQICKHEKEKAMARYESDDAIVRQDAAQAVNAWDELLGQLYKHNHVRPDRFSKTKDTALSIVAMISDAEYRERMTQKICSL